MANSHCNFLLHKVRPPSTNPFPSLGETFGHPFSPFYERWSRAQQVAGHYFRPGFVSLPLPFPSPIYLRSALQSVARPVQLPESSYMGRRGLHDTARARASPPPHCLTHQDSRAHAHNPQEFIKTKSQSTATRLYFEAVGY